MPVIESPVSQSVRKARTEPSVSWKVKGLMRSVDRNLLPLLLLSACFNYSLPFLFFSVTPQKVVALFLFARLISDSLGQSISSKQAAFERHRAFTPLVWAYACFSLLEILRAIRFSEIGLIVPAFTNAFLCLGLWVSLKKYERFWVGFSNREFDWLLMITVLILVIVQLEQLSEFVSRPKEFYTGMRLSGLGDAATINLWAMSLFSLIVYAIRATSPSKVRWTATVFLIALLLFSFSRSIVFTLLVFIFLTALAAPRSMRSSRIFFLLCLTSISVILLINNLYGVIDIWSDRLTISSTDGSVSVRLAAWGATAELFNSSPILGASDLALDRAGPQENTLLFIAARYGMVGLILFFWSMGWLIMKEVARIGGSAWVTLIPALMLIFTNENLYSMSFLFLLFASGLIEKKRGFADDK